MKTQPYYGKYICPRCQQRQWSVADNRYLELFAHCWSCDKKEWEGGRLSLEEFERREKEAVQS